MSSYLRQNFARGLLASGITALDIQITLSAGHSLPTSAGQMVLVVWDMLVYSNPADDLNTEVMIAEYSGTPNVYNITRAQESTLASVHSTGDEVALHLTAGVSQDDLLVLGSYKVDEAGILTNKVIKFDGSKLVYANLPWSTTASGLTYTAATGVLSLTSGYVVPTTTEETNWNAAYSASHARQHDIASASDHTASGLTIGHVIRASAANAFAWAQLLHADLGSVGANDHHNQAHVLNSSDHTVSGLTAGHVLQALSATTFGFAAVPGLHDAVTLATSADVLLGLTGQQLSLDTQVAARVLAGPTTGDPAAPTFRALAATDIPALAYDATGTASGIMSTHASTYDHTLLHAAVTVTAAPLTLSGQALTFNYDTNDFQLSGNNLQVKDGGIDHGGLGGLADDDHTIYFKADGTRALSGNVTIPTTFSMYPAAGGMGFQCTTGSPNSLTIRHKDASTQGVLRVCPNGSPATWNTALQLFETDHTADQINYSVLNMFSWSDSYRINTATGGSGILRPLRLGGNGAATTLYLHTDGNVGINVATPLAKLHIDQSSTTAAKPVLTLDQADVSEEFIRFIGTSANGVLTQSIVDDADITTRTVVGWVKVYVQDDGDQLTDQVYYMPVYTLA